MLLTPTNLVILALLLVFLLLRGIVALEGPIKRLAKWLDQFVLDIRAMKADGVDPETWWEFYRVYRKYKRGELK